MEWFQVLALFVANAGFLLLFRSESRNDYRRLNEKIERVEYRTCVIENNYMQWLRDKK